MGALMATVLLVSGTVHAVDPDYDEVLHAGRIPRLPAPFTLPELTHGRFDARLDGTLGTERPTDPTRPHSVAAIVQPSFEARLRVPRLLFLGLDVPIVAALPPDGGLAPGEVARANGTRTLIGNVEGHLRAVFTLPMWIEVGFTLGIVAPTASFDRGSRPARSVATAAASLDPTSQVQFEPGRVAFRPAGDLRIVRGSFVVQGRHGYDVVVDDKALESAKVVGRLVGHVGWLASPDLEVSVEASQSYSFVSEPPDAGGGTPADRAFRATYRVSNERRAAVMYGPGIRYVTRDLDIGAMLVTNAGEPLSPVVGAFWGLRVSVIGHVSPEL